MNDAIPDNAIDAALSAWLDANRRWRPDSFREAMSRAIAAADAARGLVPEQAEPSQATSDEARAWIEAHPPVSPDVAALILRLLENQHAALVELKNEIARLRTALQAAEARR